MLSRKNKNCTSRPMPGFGGQDTPGRGRRANLIDRSLLLAILCVPQAALAQSAATNCMSSANQLDLSCAAIQAINNYGVYQPQSNTYPFTKWILNSFTGGTLMQNGQTITTLAAGSSATPTVAAIWSQVLVNCDESPVSIAVAMDVNVNSSTSLTSDKGTTSSNSQDFSGTTTVTVGYTPPSETGGGSASVSQSFTYGTDHTATSSSDTSLFAGAGYSVDYSQTLSMNLPANSIQVVQFQDSVISYSNAIWSVPYILQGNINATYWQQFVTYLRPQAGVNTIQAPNYTASFGSSGQPANYYLTSTNPMLACEADGGTYGNTVASPNGFYALTMDPKGPLDLLYLSGPNQLTTYFSVGSIVFPTTPTTPTGLYFNMDAPLSNGGCGWGTSANGNPYYGSPWISTSNGTVAPWNSGKCAYSVGLRNDGVLSFYNQSNVATFNSGSPPASLQPIVSPAKSLASTTVLGTNPVFTASGTVSATLYSASGYVVNGQTQTMTSAQRQQYCATTPSASAAPVTGAAPIATTPKPSGKGASQGFLLPRSQYRQSPNSRVNVKVLGSKLPSKVHFFPGPANAIQGRTVPTAPQSTK